MWYQQPLVHGNSELTPLILEGENSDTAGRKLLVGAVTQGTATSVSIGLSPEVDENLEEPVESLLAITQRSERQRRAPVLQLDLEELPYVYVLHLVPFSMQFSMCLFLNFSFKLSLVRLLILYYLGIMAWAEHSVH